jgi:hypothetical protein
MQNSLMRNRWPGLSAVIMLLLLAGCQSAGRDQASRNSGPNKTFGLNYVPQQSEPPVEPAASVGKRADLRQVAATDRDTDSRAASAKSSGKPSRWLPGGDKEPAPRKPLPLSDRSAASIDDDRDL